MLGLGKNKKYIRGGGLCSNDDLSIRHLKHGGGGGGVESIDPQAYP